MRDRHLGVDQSEVGDHESERSNADDTDSGIAVAGMHLRQRKRKAYKSQSFLRFTFPVTSNLAGIQKLLDVWDEVDLNDAEEDSDRDSDHEQIPSDVSTTGLTAHPSLITASAGFLLFVSKTNNAKTRQYIKEMERDGYKDRKLLAEDIQFYICQAMRLAWLRLPTHQRRRWEHRARENLRKSITLNDMRNETMPPSEIPFRSETIRAIESRMKLASCFPCLLCDARNSFNAIGELQNHLVAEHDHIQLFACHYCLRAFTSIDALRRHSSCTEFAMYLVELMAGGREMLMQVAVPVIVCIECDLQFPVTSSHIAEQFAVINSHNTTGLMSVVVYFGELPQQPEHNRAITIDYIPWLTGIPIKCNLCAHDFASVDDMEGHMQSAHAQIAQRLSCSLCGKRFSWHFLLRDHLLFDHLDESSRLCQFFETASVHRPIQDESGLDREFASAANRDHGKASAEVICDLCFAKVKVSEQIIVDDLSQTVDFNTSHGCARGKTRRLLDHGELLRVPSVKLGTVAIEVTQGGNVEEVLLESLRERFSRTATLTFGRIKNSVKDMAVTDTVYLCTRCHAFSMGENNAEMHFKYCPKLADEMNVFDENDPRQVFVASWKKPLMQARLQCHECLESACSLVALRRHYAIVHGIYTHFAIDTAHGDDDEPKWRRLQSKRVLDTNLALGFTPAGFPNRGDTSNSRKKERGIVATARTSTNTASSSTSPAGKRWKTTSDTGEHGPTETPSSWFCPVCKQRYNTVQNLTKHLINHHMHVCNACGACFVLAASLLTHKTRCRLAIRGGQPPALAAQCNECKLIVSSPLLYYCHLIEHHSDKVNFDDDTGQVHPMHTWQSRPLSMLAPRPTVSNCNAEGGAAIPAMLVVRPVLNDPAVQLKCYLCDLQLATQAQYDLHVSKHPEVWDKCPVCFLLYQRRVTPIGTHADLYQHIVHQHIRHDATDGVQKPVCPLCVRTAAPTDDSMMRHILFECTSITACLICNDALSRNAPRDLVLHRKSQHPRFSCNACNRTFAYASSFAEHRCMINRCQCSCGLAQTFLSHQQFRHHFNLHLGRDLTCQLCDIQLQDYNALTEHMQVHVIPPERFRKMLINAVLAIKNTNLPTTTSTTTSQGEIASSQIEMRASVCAGTADGTTMVKSEKDVDDDVVILSPRRPVRSVNATANSGDNTVQADLNSTVAQMMSSKEDAIETVIEDSSASNSGDVAHPVSELPHGDDGNAVSSLNMGVVRQEPVEENVADAVIVQEMDETAAAVDALAEVLCDDSESGMGCDAAMNDEDGRDRDESSVISALVRALIAHVIADRETANDDETMDGEMAARCASSCPSEMSASDKLMIDDHIETGIGEEAEHMASADDRLGQREQREMNNASVTTTFADDEDDDDDVIVLEHQSSSEAVADAACTATSVETTEEEEGCEVERRREETSCSSMTRIVEVSQTVDEPLRVLDAVSSPMVSQRADARATHADDHDEIILEESDSCTHGSVRRRPTHRCNFCSQAFLTRGALGEHERTHAYDAGATLTQVLGVPLGRSLYVCRLCCLAYESRVVQSEHVKTHGVFRSCLDCSMLCFTDQQMAQHQEAHREKNKIIFGCSICLMAFETEERLHQHSRTQHGQSSVYFCKLCGFGSTENTVVVRHVINDRACPADSSTFPGKPIQKIGMCSASKLHFQPVDAGKYEKAVEERYVEAAMPAECVHRSFLTTNEAVITCDQCFSLIPATKLVLECERLRTKGPLKLTMAPVVEGNYLPGYLSTPCVTPSTRPGSVIHRVSPVVHNPSGTTQYHLPGVIPASPMQPVATVRPTLRYGTTHVVPQAFSARMPIPTGGVAQQYMAGGTEQSGGGTRFPHPHIRVQHAPPATIPAVPQVLSLARLKEGVWQMTQMQNAQRRVQRIGILPPPVVNGVPRPAGAVTTIATHPRMGITRPPQPSAPPSQQVSMHMPISRTRFQLHQSSSHTSYYTTAHGEIYCSVSSCNERLASTAAAHVHKLKHNMDTHFCLECGTSSVSEQVATIHMLKHMGKSAMRVQLKCPLCVTRPFVATSVGELRRHLVAADMAEHRALRFTSAFKHCQLKFATREAATAHQTEHELAHSQNSQLNPTQLPCCLLCGTVTKYWIQKNSVTANHVVVHGFSRWKMCRDCGLCFLNDNLFREHFTTVHVDNTTTCSMRVLVRQKRCIACNLHVAASLMEQHMIERHLVTGLKLKPNMALEVDDQLHRLLGIPPASV